MFNEVSQTQTYLMFLPICGSRFKSIWHQSRADTIWGKPGDQERGVIVNFVNLLKPRITWEESLCYTGLASGHLCKGLSWLFMWEDPISYGGRCHSLVRRCKNCEVVEISSWEQVSQKMHMHAPVPLCSWLNVCNQPSQVPALAPLIWWTVTWSCKQE